VEGRREAPAGFRRISREQWARLAPDGPTGLTEQDLEPLWGLNEHLDLDEVRTVLLPLTDFLRMRAEHDVALRIDTADFLGMDYRPAPYVIGVVGSVAVGKSTLAKVLQALLQRAPEHPGVDVVATDSFLFDNDELQRRGILHRKGFPESYDWDALVSFLLAVRAGEQDIEVPVYSHVRYDVLPDEVQRVASPELLIIEGINLLQAPPPGSGPVLPSDLVDLAIYVDASEADLRRWFVDRFLALRAAVFIDPESFFHEYADLSDEQAVETAERVWKSINGRNLREHIAPTRARADLVLVKGADHDIGEIHLRAL
jgi:type I pantothenate kinase